MPATKTARKTAECVSGTNGNRLEPGNHPKNTGGKKGRSGRKPEEFRAWCRSLVEGKAHVAEIKAVLCDRAHPHFAKIATLFYGYGYGQPTATLDINTNTRFVVRMPEVPESTADWLERYKPETLSQQN